MTTVDFITALFYEVDEQLRAIPKHPEAHLWPSEVVTLGLLHALKGGGNRAFYRWLMRDYRPLFPRVPERTRLFRLFMTHQDWTRPSWGSRRYYHHAQHDMMLIIPSTGSCWATVSKYCLPQYFRASPVSIAWHDPEA